MRRCKVFICVKLKELLFARIVHMMIRYQQTKRVPVVINEKTKNTNDISG